MGTPNEQIINRADMVIGDLSANGGLLTPEQSNAFLDMVLEQPTILSQVRTVRMSSPEVRVNRIGFGGRILTAASQTGGQEDNGTNGRYVPKAKRASPITSQIKLNSSEVIAEIRIPYEVLEDNIEGDNLEQHIMRLIAAQAAVDLEEWALFADTASADPFLALQDGYMKRMGLHVVDNLNAGISPDVFANALLAMPQKYLRNLSQMRAFVSHANAIKYRQKVSTRATGYGDAALQQAVDIYAHGLRVEPAAMLAADGVGTSGFVTIPQNLLFGIRRDISIESERNIRGREFVIVLTMRPALGIEDNNATVKLVKL